MRTVVSTQRKSAENRWAHYGFGRATTIGPG
jgi:hypothetical protein